MKLISNSNHSNHRETFISLCDKTDEIVMASPFCYSHFEKFANAVAKNGSVKKVGSFEENQFK